MTSARAAALNPAPAAQLLNRSIIPGAFATEEPLYVELGGANSAIGQGFYENTQGAQSMLGLDHSSYEEAFPNG